MVVERLGSGLGGQIGFATESPVALGTIVTPDTFIEFASEAVKREVTPVRVDGISGTLFPRAGRVRDVFRGGMGPINNIPLLTTGLARMLKHMFGGYVFSWPGSTNAEGELTLAAVPTANDTLVIEGQTYTFKAALTASTTANEILIASTIALQCSYIAAAINRGIASDGKGPGEAYGSLTPLNADVTAVATATTVEVTDKQARGTEANSGGDSEVATTETFTDVGNVWAAATLTGGVDGTDTRRRHTYTFNGSALRELATTLQIVRPPSEASRQAWTYSGGKIVSWQLTQPADGALMITPTVHVRSESLATAIASASYPADADFFDFTQAAFTIDSVSEPIQSFSLTAALGLVTGRYQLGSAAPRNQLVNARPALTGSFDREFENRDLYDAWIAGERGALALTSTGGTIPSSASPYAVGITLPSVKWSGDTPNIGGPDLVRGAIPFEVLDDGSNPPITLTYDTDEGYVGDHG